jgi:hypothetical protein
MITLKNPSGLTRNFYLSKGEERQVEVVGLVEEKNPVQRSFQLILEKTRVDLIKLFWIKLLTLYVS